MPSKNGTDSIASALGEVSDKLAKLVQDEIELAKAEVTEKVSSLARGAAAVAAGAVFGIFAVIFGLATLAWGLNSLLSSIWLGFLITFAVLLALTVGAFLFALKKLKVGAPTPKLAIDEGKKIKDTVVGFGATAATNGHGQGSPVSLTARSSAPAHPAVAAPPVPAAAPASAPAAPVVPEPSVAEVPVTPAPVLSPLPAEPTPDEPPQLLADSAPAESAPEPPAAASDSDLAPVVDPEPETPESSTTEFPAVEPDATREHTAVPDAPAPELPEPAGEDGTAGWTIEAVDPTEAGDDAGSASDTTTNSETSK